MRTFNITETFVDEDYPWLSILSGAPDFEIISTKNRLKGYSPVQLVFERDMIIPMKHKVDWELIRQRKQTQINKYNIHINRKRVYHDYRVRDKFMLNNNAAYKYEMPYTGPFLMTRFFSMER